MKEKQKMKKLMMAAAIVCAAVAANAATCSWKSGQFYDVEDEKGGWSTTKLQSGVIGYLFQLTAAQYATLSTDFSQKTIYSGFNGGSTAATSTLKIGDTAVTATKRATEFSGAVTLAGNETVSGAGDKLYAAVVYTYNDGDADYYIANVGNLTYGGTGSAVVNNLNTAIGGSTSTPATTQLGWQAVESVPEPFSGTLALLGMGAIALRRKMKKAKKA